MAQPQIIIGTNRFPKLGEIIPLPKVCPGREDHPSHEFMTAGLVERVEEERGFCIVRDDHDFDTIKILVKVEA